MWNIPPCGKCKTFSQINTVKVLTNEKLNIMENIKSILYLFIHLLFHISLQSTKIFLNRPYRIKLVTQTKF